MVGPLMVDFRAKIHHYGVKRDQLVRSFRFEMEFFVVFKCFQITQLSSPGKEKKSNWFSIHGALSSVLRAQPRTPTRCSGGFRDGCGLVWGWRHGGPTRSGVPSHSVWRVGNSSGYPLVSKHSYWKWLFIVDFPLKMVILHSYMLVYQRVAGTYWNHIITMDVQSQRWTSVRMHTSHLFVRNGSVFGPTWFIWLWAMGQKPGTYLLFVHIYLCPPK